MPYDHTSLDAKWQQRWEEARAFEADATSDKEPFYCLIEFPYPSGAGLHMGHPRSYTAMDVVARKRRMQGYNVLYPMGWDAFGLPTENYAIKTGRKPQDVTAENVATFKRQLKSLGLSFDWSREINTTDPSYYKWTQWMFLEFFKEGLAYKKAMAINWCLSCKIGLANEEVVNGACERCGGAVEKRDKEQWMIAITKYADRLLADLDTVDYLPKIRKQQEDWIGRKEGMVFDHAVEGMDLTIQTFTAYPAWSFADSYLVLAPEHPLVGPLVAGQPEEAAVQAFVASCREEQADARTADTLEKRGVFTGRVALDPLTGAQMPIWLANFALMEFGTGAIRCSAHDVRDVAFATMYDIPLKEVVDRVDPETPVNAHENVGTLKDSGPFTGRTIDASLIEEMMDWFKAQGYAKRHVSYRLRDWVFSRQRYWGEPIPLVKCAGACGTQNDGWVAVPEDQLPVTLPEVERYEPTDDGESPLAAMTDWVNTTCPECGGPATRETDTMPNWAGSSWYFLRYIDPANDAMFADRALLDHWMPVDWYNGGMEHTTLHLLYSRFWNKVLFDRGHVPSAEPYAKRTSHGLILAEDGTKMSKSKGNVVNPDELVQQFGADALRLLELFIGPFGEPAPYSHSGMVGMRRFLEKVMDLPGKVVDQETRTVQNILHKTMKKVSEDIEEMRFNTAVSQLMVFVNTVQDEGGLTKETLRRFLRLLSPFAPHVAEEVYEHLGEGLLVQQPWDTYDPALAKDDLVTIGVQVNGKVRGDVTLAPDAPELEARAAALALPSVQTHLQGKEPKKIIYLPGKIISIVV